VRRHEIVQFKTLIEGAIALVIGVSHDESGIWSVRWSNDRMNLRVATPLIVGMHDIDFSH